MAFNKIICILVFGFSSSLALAANPGNLIDTSSQPASAASCSKILNAALSNNRLTFQQLDQVGDARNSFDQKVQSLQNQNPNNGSAIYTANIATQNKIQALNAKRDYDTINSAAFQCISLLK